MKTKKLSPRQKLIRELLIALALIVVLTLILLVPSVYLFLQSHQQLSRTTPSPTPIQTAQYPTITPTPSLSPTRTAIATPSKPQTLDQLKAGRTKSPGTVDLKYKDTSNGVESIKSVNLTTPQSMLDSLLNHLSTTAFAQDSSTVKMPKIIFQNLSSTKQAELLQIFGFTSEPTRPDKYNMNYLVWNENGRYLIVDPGGSYKLKYIDTTVDTTSLPSVEDAKIAVTQFVKSKNLIPFEFDTYSEDSYALGFFSDTLSGGQTVSSKGVAVKIFAKYNGKRLTFNDLGGSLVNGKIQVNPIAVAYVGAGGKIAVFADYAYLLRLDESDTATYHQKTSEEALADLKANGGVVTYALPHNQPDNSGYYQNRGRIHDAEINQAELVYYYNTYLPGYRYVKNDNSYAFAYLTPVWLFAGQGQVVLSLDDKVPFDRPADFVTLVYAVKGNKGQKLFQATDFYVKPDGNGSVQASFTISFNFPLFLDWVYPHARQGLRYSALVLYPDNTYLEFTDVIYSVDGNEVITFPQKVKSGQIRVVISLPDFPATMEERTVDL